MTPHSLRAGLTVAVALAVAGCGPRSVTPHQAPTDDPSEAVSALVEGYLQAIAARDTAEIRRSYVNDDRFVWIEDGQVRYRNVDQVIAGFASIPAASPIRTELTDLTIVWLGSSGAHAWATFKTSIGTGPRAFSFGGAISILAEHVDGTWKIVGGHTSSPRQP